MRGYKPAQSWIDSLPAEVCYISVITAAELLAGSRNLREQRRIERELALYETIWLSESVSRSALDLYRRFHLSQQVGFFDCLIAATAEQHALQLATLNLKHFAPLGVRARKPY
ncbi:MAG: type II toxin-antitoxin system VapC family toxin [Anaerolineales bacterium]|nr:type II toxin-antitoxin system VapC family toxin [Anaerolineales bacterium]